MTYQELATRLLALGKLLQEHSTELSGESTVKIVKTLADNADKLENAIQTAISQITPESIRLREILDKNDAFFPVSQLQSIAKKLDFKLPGGKKVTPFGARAKFVELAMGNGVAQKAIDLAEAFIRIKTAIGDENKPDLSNEEALRAEIRRLGAKSPDEIEFEIQEKFTDVQTRMLAKAVGLKVTKSASKKSLIPKIIHYARRNYEHTAMSLGD